MSFVIAGVGLGWFFHDWSIILLHWGI